MFDEEEKKIIRSTFLRGPGGQYIDVDPNAGTGTGSNGKVFSRLFV